MFFYLLQGLGLGGAAAQPGPFQAYLLSQTLKNGWRRTIWAAFAPLISDGPIVALMLFVLTRTPAWFLNLLRIGGGVFLIYLAYGAFVSMQTAVSSQPELSSTTSHRTILEAALMNALSPNPYIFWATVAGPVLIEGWRQAPAFGISFVVGFYGTLIGDLWRLSPFLRLRGRLTTVSTASSAAFRQLSCYCLVFINFGLGQRPS